MSMRGLVVALVLAAPSAWAQDGDLRGVIIEAVRAEGCTMDESTAERVFGRMGLDRTTVGMTVRGMIGAGDLTASPTGDRIALSPELCGEAGGTVATAEARGGEAASAGVAVDLRAATLAYIQAWDCSASAGLLAELASDVHGRDPSEMQAVVDALAAEGIAEVDAQSGDVAVRAPHCEASPDYMVVGANSWIQEWLYAAEDCRLPLAELAARAETQELRADAFDLALASLVVAGLVRQEGVDIVHATACRPRPVPTEAELIESERGPGFRGMMLLRVLEGGCRVPMEGREAWLDATVAWAVERMPFTKPPSAEGLAAVRAGLQEVLDNPSPAYEIDGASGDLVLVQCSP